MSTDELQYYLSLIAQGCIVLERTCPGELVALATISFVNGNTESLKLLAEQCNDPEITKIVVENMDNDCIGNA